MDAFALVDGFDVDKAAVPTNDAAGVDVRELYRTAPPMEGERVAGGLPVGTPAPDFSLPDASGRVVRLSDFRGRPVALVFYPLDWSPGCSVQLDLYQQEIAEFESRGIQLIGISADSIYSHGAWAAVRGIRYPLLSDFHPKGETARAYNVWRVRNGFSERAVYLIDDEGVIRWAHVSPQLHHLPDFDELVAALETIKAPETGSAPIESEGERQ
ncbi:redoxin domain-containing protein [Gryllotalpicola kribbensis]|jgi:peroxiredoxin|uniref:Redoxin domain-containing protein n=1 Tax=Gryllotalpicola kribbensis TaxID=993084 RepID=A0ABP8AIN9_9MICO